VENREGDTLPIAALMEDINDKSHVPRRAPRDAMGKAHRKAQDGEYCLRKPGRANELQLFTRHLACAALQVRYASITRACRALWLNLGSAPLPSISEMGDARQPRSRHQPLDLHLEDRDLISVSSDKRLNILTWTAGDIDHGSLLD
jgi:hypothetical protein